MTLRPGQLVRVKPRPPKHACEPPMEPGPPQTGRIPTPDRVAPPVRSKWRCPVCCSKWSVARGRLWQYRSTGALYRWLHRRSSRERKP